MRTLFFWIPILLIGLSGTANSWAQEAPLVEAPGRAAVEQAQGSFIFVFDPRFVGSDDVPGLARGLTEEHGAALGHIYTHAIQGFSANISAEGAEQLANRNPFIQYYEPDGVVWMVDAPSVIPQKKPDGSPGKGPKKKDPPP